MYFPKVLFLKWRTKMIFEIVIPVLNEEATLQNNTEKILQYIESHLKEDFRICIADNGSSDATPQIAKELVSRFSKLRFVQVSQKGVGRALKESWGTSNADIIGYMDLDIATSLEHLHTVEKEFSSQNVDVLYGSRLNKKSVVKNRKLIRGIISVFFNLLVRLTFKTSIKDSMCGFKFLRRDKLNLLRSNGAVTDGWFFCAEIVILADRLGLKVLELPVVWTDDPNSKVKILKLALEYLKNMNTLKKKIKQ